MGTALATHVSRPRLLKPEDAADYLGIAHWKLLELARNGALASIKVHRTIRFDPADLDSFIELHRRPVVTTKERIWIPRRRRPARIARNKQRNRASG
jgi:excisionase family DNA binding protein